MNFCDYSPPALPSLDQQQDALQKGLGRAWQWALNGRLSDEPLLQACLRDQRFDVQCEDSRASWLWQIVQALGAAQRFRVPILHALHEMSDERSASQLCKLAHCYARAGDETFRDRLYEIVGQKPFSDRPWLGEEEILALDGEQAFLFAAHIRGQQLASREWEWDDGNLIAQAIDRFGEERVSILLSAFSDTALARFRECWRQDKQKAAEARQPLSHQERMRAISVEEIIRIAEGDSKRHLFRGWGIHAEEDGLRTVLQRLWAEQRPRVIANLLAVFSARALPELDARLIEFCRHDDEEVRRRAFHALEKNTHPLIREFALTELQRGTQGESVVGLFINNYRHGDEQRILDALELPENACKLHWLLIDVTKVLEQNPEADCSQLGVMSYALTPCANCRFDAARLVLQKDVAPGWLKEECRYDCGEDCRQFVEELDAG